MRGYRTDNQYTHIVPVSKAYPGIRIGYTSEGYEDIQQWLADRFPDLDVQQQEQEAQEILQDDALGRTEAEREEKLLQAQRLCRVLNIAAWAVAAWLFFYPQPYSLATQAALALPPVALLAMFWHRGLIRADERKDSAYPSLASALFMPSLALLLRVLFDFELLEHTLVWPLAAAVAAVFGGLLAYGSWRFISNSASRWSALAMLLFCALAYGYAAPAAYNCAFDKAIPQVHQAAVHGKHSSSGKTTTYYLAVGPWGPRTTPEDVTVTKELYEQTQAGDTVHAYLFPGRLGIPWFSVEE
ncbi:hypothetical protein [Hymenobacter psychrotolerans]|uniref:hypothetical protein n=1 Tax=Hymenobacter psychrotolerans TaxID=344998 RepID=UPI001114C66E|nr:hypothetical protein [Hymenobacter psychrotolerans]